jgi:nitrile hydratase
MEIGIQTSNPNAPTVLSVVENTPEVHNLVVCTLCSCYPSGLLGLSPSWYKSSEFRSRAVREPRSVLQEFGTSVPQGQTIRVHDSTADHRYLVLPQRPVGTEDWSEEQLRRLVTRDSMIGVSIPSLLEVGND